jgi:hypothetical protein
MRHAAAAFLVLISGAASAQAPQVSADPAVLGLVQRLDMQAFKRNIEELTQWENRVVGSAGNRAAVDWLVAQLESYGYQVTRHRFMHTARRSGQTDELENVWATKVGTTNPERMYIISGHMDSVRRSKGANDDASGSSLVLEAARVFAADDVHTGASVRFVLWNAEETGMRGAEAYVKERRALQGVEEPPGSRRYPEPTWLGIVTHDQILFDHGLPAEAEQSPRADIDIEYQMESDQRSASIALAAQLLLANGHYAADYPAEATGDMGHTDSVPFENDCAAVSIRENRRRAEMPNGAAPHWHQETDVYATYSELDFLFGFNMVQTTVGAIAALAGLKVDER